MDLTFNFAAPQAGPSRPRTTAASVSSASAPSGSAAVGPQRWTQRMKQSQAARRQQHKQQPPKLVSTDTDAITAAVPSAAVSVQISPSKSSKGKERARADVANDENPARSVQASSRSGKTSVSTRKPGSHDTIAEVSTGSANQVDPANVGGKRQVISSLFPKVPGDRRRARVPLVDDDEQDSATLGNGDVITPSNAPSVLHNFAQSSLPPELVAHLTGKMGLAHPTMIQKLSLPLLCDVTQSSTTTHHDAIIQAQTGSGKTLAYLLPIIHDLIQVARTLREAGIHDISRAIGTCAIILVPTRELANQIFDVACKLLSFHGSEDSDNHRWITPGLLIGGAHRQHEKARLRKGVPLLIATPGRLLDHLEATKAFRIAGDPIRSAKSGKAADNDDDDFDIEDQIQDAGKPYAAERDDISSDEDFANMPTSRSHRSQKYLKAKSKDGQSHAALSMHAVLALRWLVLDEADRLMDMGFEPQIESMLKLLEARVERRRRIDEEIGDNVDARASRRTVLCSATVGGKVDQLAGAALKSPVLISASSADTSVSPNELSPTIANHSDQYTAPAQLRQFYAVVEPKLRFVALAGLLRKMLLASDASHRSQKILVFLSCTDAVDLYWRALAGLTMGRDAEPVSAKSAEGKTELHRTSQLYPNTSIYHLHGSLDLQTRLGSLKGFASAQDTSAIMLCTSVAARGLDVDDVTAVVQYDLPTEGGVNEYLHRIGRTARAGAAGQSWAFVLPSEQGWVNWVDDSLAAGGAASSQETAKIQAVSIENILKSGFGGRSPSEYETRATDVQMGFERWVIANKSNLELARKACASHIRAYATHPSNEKQFFHVKNLHLGHVAKSFGLREAPAGLGTNSASKKVTTGGKAITKQEVTSNKRKRPRPVASESSDDEAKRSNKNLIPRSGRAIDGKGLHGPKGIVGSDFNIASTAHLESLLQRKK